ncbi:unnamed protein product, partial [Polarella glacialis]
KSVAAPFADQRCIIVAYLLAKQRWQVKLADERFQGKQVLVPEKDVAFDFYTAPSQLLPPLPAHLGVDQRRP